MNSATRERGQADRQQQRPRSSLNSVPAAAEPTISTSSAGTKPAWSISTPNSTSDSGSTISARSDQLPSIFSLLRRPDDDEIEAEQRPDAAEHGREIAGAHAQRGAERIVAGDDHRRRAGRDQHHAGPEILVVGIRVSSTILHRSQSRACPTEPRYSQVMPTRSMTRAQGRDRRVQLLRLDPALLHDPLPFVHFRSR